MSVSKQFSVKELRAPKHTADLRVGARLPPLYLRPVAPPSLRSQQFCRYWLLLAAVVPDLWAPSPGVLSQIRLLVAVIFLLRALFVFLAP